MTEVVVMLLSVPQVVPEQPAPERLQVTPLLAASLSTEAEKLEACESVTEAKLGLTETEMG